MRLAHSLKHDPDKVFFRHWSQLVPDTASAKKNMKKELTKTAALCLEKGHDLKTSLEKEGIKSPIFEEICDVISKRVKCVQDI